MVDVHRPDIKSCYTRQIMDVHRPDTNLLHARVVDVHRLDTLAQGEVTRGSDKTMDFHNEFVQPVNKTKLTNSLWKSRDKTLRGLDKAAAAGESSHQS